MLMVKQQGCGCPRVLLLAAESIATTAAACQLYEFRHMLFDMPTGTKPRLVD